MFGDKERLANEAMCTCFEIIRMGRTACVSWGAHDKRALKVIGGEHDIANGCWADAANG